MASKEKARANGPIPSIVPWKNSSESKAISGKSQARRGGRASRDKGNRAERAIVKFLQERGFAAEIAAKAGSQ